VGDTLDAGALGSGSTGIVKRALAGAFLAILLHFTGLGGGSTGVVKGSRLGGTVASFHLFYTR
jgi:hypothetical protein